MAPPLSDIPELIERINAAIAESEQARAASDRATEELASERRWRRWAAVFAVVLAVVIIAVGVVGVVMMVSVRATQRDNHRTLIAIQQATTPSSAQVNTAQSLITRVVNEPNCGLREDIAQVVHLAVPSVPAALPATAFCPAFTP